MRAAEDERINEYLEDYETEWASKSMRLLNRLMGATFELEMRMDTDKGLTDGMVQQARLESLRAAVDDDEVGHDAMTVHILGHLEALANRLEALVGVAECCDTHMFCKCRMPLTSEYCDLGVEEVMCGRMSIREYLLDMLDQLTKSTPTTASNDPEGHERMTMVYAWRGLGAVFKSCMPLAPKTIDEFVGVWKNMWKTEHFKKCLHNDLIARKEEARQRVKAKKPHHGKKSWRDVLLRRNSEDSDTPTRPSIRAIRSWA